MLDTILLAVDFSELTEVTLDQAAHLARQFDAEIVPLHAVEYVPYYAYADGLQLIRQELDDRMASLAENLRIRGARVAAPVVGVDAAWRLIVDTADAVNANLILLGGGRKSFAERLLAGATAEKVVRRARQPVWVMHADDHRPFVKSVLCAVDFSPSSREALSIAQHLCHVLGASLSVLHVDPVEGHYPGLPGIDIPVQRLHSGQIGGDLPSPAGLDELRAWMEGFNLAGLDVSALVRHGDVATWIVDTARDGGYDMVVMGAIGHGGFIHQLLGSTTESILRDVPCSLLAVKHQDLFRIHHEVIQPPHPGDYLRQVDEIAAYIEAHYAAGKEMLAQGFHEDAITEFTLCIEKDPHFSSGYEAIALAYERSGHPQEAQTYLELGREHRRHVWTAQIKTGLQGAAGASDDNAPTAAPGERR